MADILDSLVIKKIELRNRVVYPPVVVFFADGSGTVTDKHVRHYRRIAEGGTGLIIIEATCVQRDARLAPEQLGLWEDAQVAGMAAIADACHAAGAKVLVQIHHGGLKTHEKVSTEPICPSVVLGTGAEAGKRLARAMTVEEIVQVRQDFVDAAARAKQAGLDGVELHAAHGYLLNQFASPGINRREDDYGGDLGGRLRLATEVIRGIRDEVADERFLIDVRMGCNDPDLGGGIAIAKHYEGAGADLLHVSAGMGSDADRPDPPAGYPYNWIVFGGERIAEEVKIPVIAVNGIRSHGEARDLLTRSVALVALARGHLVDPSWAGKIAYGADIVTCLDCEPRCHWFRDAPGCPRYDPAWDET